MGLLAVPVVHDRERAKAKRLGELGLSEEILVRAVLSAEMDRRNTSSLEPRTAAGFKAWAAACRELAGELNSQGWRIDETGGPFRIVNPETAIAVLVVNGDDGVGQPERTPRSRSQKGERIQRLVQSNVRQASLFPERDYVPTPSIEFSENWWLLLYSDGSVVRAELSLPLGMGEDNRLSEWAERIIIKVPESAPQRFLDDESPLTVDVEVRPRPRP